MTNVEWALREAYQAGACFESSKRIYEAALAMDNEYGHQMAAMAGESRGRAFAWMEHAAGVAVTP